MLFSTVISSLLLLTSFHTIAFHNSCHRRLAVNTRILLTPELIPLLEFVMAPVVLSAVLVQQKEVSGLRNQVAALANESNNTSTFNPFIEEFRKELQSSLESAVPSSGAATASTELLVEVQELNARLINLEKRLDKIGSDSESSVVTSNTMQARVSLLEDTISKVENSLGTLQEADEQSLTLQQLIVGDINSLKSIVAEKSVPVDNQAAREQPAMIELERKVEELSTLVSGDAALLKSTLTSLSLDLDDSIEGMQNRLESQMQQKMGDLKDKVTLLAAKVDSGDADNAEAFNALLDERLASTREILLDNVSSSLADTEERTTSQIEELATRLMSETQRTEVSVSTVTAAIKSEVDEKIRELDEALELVEKGKEELSRRLEEVDQSLETRAEAVAIRVSTWSRVKRTAVGVVRGTVGVVKKPFVGIKNFITGPSGSNNDSNGGNSSSSSSSNANKNTNSRRSDQRISARINDEE